MARDRRQGRPRQVDRRPIRVGGGEGRRVAQCDFDGAAFAGTVS